MGRAVPQLFAPPVQARAKPGAVPGPPRKRLSMAGGSGLGSAAAPHAFTSARAPPREEKTDVEEPPQPRRVSSIRRWFVGPSSGPSSSAAEARRKTVIGTHSSSSLITKDMVRVVVMRIRQWGAWLPSSRRLAQRLKTNGVGLPWAWLLTLLPTMCLCGLPPAGPAAARDAANIVQDST
jgi:hypothetical protein